MYVVEILKFNAYISDGNSQNCFETILDDSGIIVDKTNSNRIRLPIRLVNNTDESIYHSPLFFAPTINISTSSRTESSR